jgi:tRNA U34 5-methylaminomethyl-2-thiouridine-forming methyltransferase MnmC
VLQVLTTEDGSHTLYSDIFDEIYHSRRGAWQESQHVFIDAGLDFVFSNSSKNIIHILEIGFGTGLNALLTLQKLQKHPDKVIHYHGLEAFPVSENIIESLNYAEIIAEENLKPLFMKMHQVEWNQAHNITPNFVLHKIHCTLDDFDGQDTLYDLVYFDAFAPSKQPEMWIVEVFEKIAQMLSPQAVLVTYCAKGQVKRNLKLAGFRVEALPGPAGKREMTRGFYEGISKTNMTN